MKRKWREWENSRYVLEIESVIACDVGFCLFLPPEEFGFNFSILFPDMTSTDFWSDISLREKLVNGVQSN